MFALQGLSCGDGEHRPRSDRLSYLCDLHLHGEHCMVSTQLLHRCDRPDRPSVDATAQIWQRIAASLRQHPTRSASCLTTLHEP
jgi:hypothetical protein